ncbi:MAG: adenylate kinase family protein [Candidatus Aenigmarchaeota archaeon]|nr:adenylate kinase family protein [Candidatus Aenigmarchaeota archaeon]
MIVSISGTPGTGKTAVAKVLVKRLDANLISISKLLNELDSGWDKSRKTKIIDVKDLQKTVKKHLVKRKINIIDGHLSHLIDSDIVIILRCNPRVLEKRLNRKEWSKRKIKENVEAEILDEISAESKNACEIDTSNKKPDAVAVIIGRILKNPKKYKHLRIGNIDWSEKYKEYLKSK